MPVHFCTEQWGDVSLHSFSRGKKSATWTLQPGARAASPYQFCRILQVLQEFLAEPSFGYFGPSEHCQDLGSLPVCHIASQSAYKACSRMSHLLSFALQPIRKFTAVDVKQDSCKNLMKNSKKAMVGSPIFLTWDRTTWILTDCWTTKANNQI